MSNRLYEPSEQLALAAGMTERFLAEQSWGQEIVGEAPQEPLPLEIMKSMQIGMTSAMLKTIEDPTAEFKIEALTQEIFDDSTLADMLYSAGLERDELDKETIDMFRGSLNGYFKPIWEHFIDSGDEQQNMVDQLQQARTIAVKHGVSIDTVFTSEELYEELIRATDTPSTYVEKQLKRSDKLNGDFVRAVLKGLIELEDGMDYKPIGLSAQERAEKVDARLHDMLQDQGLADALSARVSAIRIAGQQLARLGVIRFWGEGSVNEVSAQLEHAASSNTQAGTDKLNRIVRHEKALSHMAAAICAEQGWDPNRLTLEQSRELHLDPRYRDML